MALTSCKLDEEKKKKLKLSDFSFAETRKLLKDCKTSFADEVVKERRESEDTRGIKCL
jgi:hypothetical protein